MTRPLKDGLARRLLRARTGRTELRRGTVRTMQARKSEAKGIEPIRAIKEAGTVNQPSDAMVARTVSTAGLDIDSTVGSIRTIAIGPTRSVTK